MPPMVQIVAFVVTSIVHIYGCGFTPYRAMQAHAKFIQIAFYRSEFVNAANINFIYTTLLHLSSL